MSLFDLSPFVATLSDSTGTVIKYSASPYGSDGKAAAKTVASTTNNVKISFQPVGQKLDRDAMGFNEKDVLFNVFCALALANGDRLTVSGVSYEVEWVAPWNQIGNYCEAIVRQLDGSEI